MFISLKQTATSAYVKTWLAQNRNAVNDINCLCHIQHCLDQENEFLWDVLLRLVLNRLLNRMSSSNKFPTVSHSLYLYVLLTDTCTISEEVTYMYLH